MGEWTEIGQRIERLAGVPGARRIYGATHHGFRLGAPVPADVIARFEKRHRIELPGAYRSWLGELSGAGAGPGNGFFELGQWTFGGPPTAWTGRAFGPLAEPFPYDAPCEKHRGAVAGAMPLCDFGCGMTGLLVTAGPQRGRIWIDYRRDRRGFVPEDGLDFRSWVEAWLAESERAAVTPEEDIPRAHPNSPDAVLPLDPIATPAMIARLREEIVANLSATGRARFGAILTFRLRGAKIEIDQGKAIAKALAGEPLPDVGTLTRLLEALFRAPPWTALEVPGLLSGWVREKHRFPMRDYLGRTQWVGDEGRFLTIGSDLRWP